MKRLIAFAAFMINGCDTNKYKPDVKPGECVELIGDNRVFAVVETVKFNPETVIARITSTKTLIKLYSTDYITVYIKYCDQYHNNL